jgi:hypothetical protein
MASSARRPTESTKEIIEANYETNDSFIVAVCAVSGGVRAYGTKPGNCQQGECTHGHCLSSAYLRLLW